MSALWKAPDIVILPGATEPDGTGARALKIILVFKCGSGWLC